MPSLSFLERANQSRYRFQFNRFSSRVSSFQLLSMQFMPLHRTQEIARYVHASGKFLPYEFASSIVGFDTSAAALTAHAEPLRCTRIRFPLFALRIFPGPTPSRYIPTHRTPATTVAFLVTTAGISLPLFLLLSLATQLRKPIRIRQNTPMLPIQILLVSLILFELL